MSDLLLKVDLRVLHDKIQQRYNVESDVGVFETAEDEPGTAKYVSDRCKIMIESKAIIDRFLLDGCYIDSVDSLQVCGLDVHFDNTKLSESGLYIGTEFYSDTIDKSLSNIKRYFTLAYNLLCFRDQCVTIFNKYEDHLIEARKTKKSSNRSANDMPEDDLTMKQEFIRGSWNLPRTQGLEENPLANNEIVNSLLKKKHKNIHAITPNQSEYYNDPSNEQKLCIKCLPAVTVSLEDLINTSPNSNILIQREYVRLEDGVCDLMNKDLELNPQIMYFTARLLAGAILLNTDNKEAVMLNTVEVFGRTRTVDCHQESFGKLKNTVKPTSIPHRNVWPTVYNKGDGEKLIIGTQVSNVLITSSMRIDQKMDPSVGGTTTHFQLKNIKDSLACQIFVDTEQLSAALE